MPETTLEHGAPTATVFAERAWICNINRQEMPLVFRSYHGPYRIASPGPNEEYAMTEIQWAKAFADRGDYMPTQAESRAEWMISATDIAQDICKTLNGNMPDVAHSFWGVFVTASAQPTTEELADAKQKLEDVMNDLVKWGDTDWARYHRYEMVSDTCRVAVKFLGLEREWAYVVKHIEPKPETMTCPACGSDLPRPDVSICRTCGATLDKEKAKHFFPAEERPTEEPRRTK